MLRRTLVVLAAVLALGTTAVSTTAFARGCGGGGGHGGTFSAGSDHFGGGFREGFRADRNRSDWPLYGWSYCDSPYVYGYRYGYTNECY